MRAVVQRVHEARVDVGPRTCGSIRHGLLVYVGIHTDDGPSDITYLTDKIRHLRVFPDARGKLNLDVIQAAGSILVVSAFTVQADARRGRRPSFETAASPQRAGELFDGFCALLSEAGIPVERGSFGDEMEVRSVNAGPVCILLDSKRLF